MTPTIGMVLVLMSLKLLQAEQGALINKFLKRKTIILNRENNQKNKS